MRLDVATQWCGQYGAAVLNPMDDEPTFHAGGEDSIDPAVRFLTLCGRRVLMTDLYLRVEAASEFTDQGGATEDSATRWPYGPVAEHE